VNESGSGQWNGSAVGAQGISAAELAKHSDNSSCWILYDGQVYDITSYMPQHKTGLSFYCGKSDGSFAQDFAAKHGTAKINMLKSVGELKGPFAG
jgi:cytochrome b involved in lipid metabolism